MAIERMVEELEQLPLRKLLSESRDAVLFKIAQLCFNEMIPLCAVTSSPSSSSQQQHGFDDKFFMITTASTVQEDSCTIVAVPSVDLMHHQYEPHKEGYNFSEINEVRKWSWLYI